MSGRVHVAEQHGGDRTAGFLARIPGLDDPGDPVRPGMATAVEVCRTTTVRGLTAATASMSRPGHRAAPGIVCPRPRRAVHRRTPPLPRRAGRARLPAPVAGPAAASPGAVRCRGPPRRVVFQEDRTGMLGAQRHGADAGLREIGALDGRDALAVDVQLGRSGTGQGEPISARDGRRSHPFQRTDQGVRPRANSRRPAVPAGAWAPRGPRQR